MINIYFEHDLHFDDVYPPHIQKLSPVHWTPVEIAKKASKFLSVEGNRVMDIGCGVGKFCLASAFFHPNTEFFGFEQRKELIGHAEVAKATLRLRNVNFIYANLSEIDLREYQSLYFFNSFHENLHLEYSIDSSINRNADLYRFYAQLLYKKLEMQPSGCRLVTYYSKRKQVPGSYKLVGKFENLELKMYVKI
ncbi:methyltransferase domain-containing protein [Pedobacter suwonensis]|uniref:methyltransferase domain-containing protein n=1 Tax=Pedobacter suwonensis TaxID=332999 RepID=UPI0036AD7C3E